jgi:alpha-glucoside transport system permease protein
MSFFGKRSQELVGLKNYHYIFNSENMLIAFRNNAIWLIFFVLLSITLGLILAVLLNRVRYEKIVKSIVFLPMAISMVGAGVIWKFMYAYQPPGVSQIGLLNAISNFINDQTFGWLVIRPWNNFFIIIVGVWIWTGFCMIILSAAYKNIPKELIDSARIDGAGEWQIFWRISFPMLRPTIAVLITTLTVFVLKVFDLVYIMTNGNFNTEVIANHMYKMLQYPDFGRASAIAVTLLVLILPVMTVNIIRYR